MFKTSGRASFLIILFSVSSVLRLCSTFRRCFFNGTFIATPSPETKIACKTFALKDRLAIIGRLLCFVTQILLLTFLTGSK